MDLILGGKQFPPFPVCFTPKCVSDLADFLHQAKSGLKLVQIVEGTINKLGLLHLKLDLGNYFWLQERQQDALSHAGFWKRSTQNLPGGILSGSRHVSTERCVDKVNGMSVASEAFSSQLLRTESPKVFFGYLFFAVAPFLFNFNKIVSYNCTVIRFI